MAFVTAEQTGYHVEMNQLNKLPKPKFGEACNGCGYCCTAEPCALAQEFLRCVRGPCVALEVAAGKAVCGLVRNPLGYLYKATHPDEGASALGPAPALHAGQQLSEEIAAALGIGQGCDADDDKVSAAWATTAAAQVAR